MAEKMTLEGASRTIVVEVTEELIAKAIPRDSGHCMIADSLRLAIPTAKNVSVDLATIRFSDPAKKRRYIYLTPPSGQQALLDFDQGNPITPFKMRLNRPVQVLLTRERITAPDGTKKQAGLQRQQGVRNLTGGDGVPTRVGGHPIPNGALATNKGRIRAFGLRQLSR